MDQFTGSDTEVDYLLTIHDDGTPELAMRPTGGARWSAPVNLTAIPAETPC